MVQRSQAKPGSSVLFVSWPIYSQFVLFIALAAVNGETELDAGEMGVGWDLRT